MDACRPLVLVTEPLAQRPASWLAERAEVLEIFEPAELPRAVARADALIVRTYTNVTRDLLSKAPKLRVVGRAGVGLDNIDLHACADHGVRVVHTPDANTQAVVEYVFALILDALRPRAALDQALPLKEWSDLRNADIAERELAECSLGILGLGRIGRRVARVATALGLEVRFNDLLTISDSERHGGISTDLTTLFSESDVVTIHIDGRAENRKFVGDALLSRMKGDALFINTSRGAVVDAAALSAFLRAHPKALAALDVHDPEPFTADYPLLGVPNARLLPHLASRTAGALERMSWVVKDVIAALGE